MSKDEIVEDLNRLEKWFIENKPQFYSKLNLGLSRDEIAALTINLGLNLPDEVIALYMWHNGTPKNLNMDFIPHYRFLPLEEAIDFYYEMIDGTIESGGEVIDQFNLSTHCEWSYSYFPIFYSIEPIVIKISKEKIKTTPVVNIFAEDSSATLMYNTLSNFINFIAECYKAEVFQINENEFGYFVEVADKDRAESIHTQFESSLPYFSL